MRQVTFQQEDNSCVILAKQPALSKKVFMLNEVKKDCPFFYFFNENIFFQEIVFRLVFGLETLGERLHCWCYC